MGAEGTTLRVHGSACVQWEVDGKVFSQWEVDGKVFSHTVVFIDPLTSEATGDEQLIVSPYSGESNIHIGRC